MFIRKNFFFILLISIIHGQNISVQFQKFPVDTDIGLCTCDLIGGACDVSCCCDLDCSSGDKQAFGCDLRDNQYTNSTPVISSVQPTCIKNISIFKSNSPYIIQKMGELVCIDYERYTGSQYYQQPTVQTLDPSIFLQSINAEYNVSPTISNNLNNYQVGTPILFNKNNTVGYYSLPVNIFNNPLCSGSQNIAYMNNFTSTCNQPVTSATCSGALNPVTYIDSLCFVRSPSDTSISNTVCGNTTANASNPLSNSSCLGALRSLTVTIYYDNPTGIQRVTLTPLSDNANGTQFQQTFTVNFIKSVPTSASSNTTRNPGYRQSAFITAGIGSSFTITTLDSSVFSILKPSSDGSCNGGLGRTPIRFGENVRSTCIYNVSPTVCPDLTSLFMSTNSSSLYVAAYSNSDPTNITTDWLPVISCTSEIGSPNVRTCGNGILSNTTGTTCYIKLDIQIAYTNIGSVDNPQSVLSAVIFHYQGVPQPSSTNPLSSPLLVMESVTFQDISDAPIIAQGQIPAPNTRLPANFFYPFSVSHATKSMTFSSVFYLTIAFLFLFM